ncbi:MAG: DNA primase [Clostridiales bacterium]|jgi:DNA primase|nr:DNA primase [Clostridiales bacterium]
MLYSDDIIEKIRLNCDIVDIVSRTVHLERKGKNFFGLCPFHAEKTPSFSVDPDKRMYYCFSCNSGGDVFKFVMETERLDFTGAVQRLAELAHVELPEDTAAGRRSAAEAARERERRNRLLAMNAAAAGMFQRALAGRGGARAREYLRGRMVGADVAAAFGLGYAGSGREDLHRILLGEGFSDEEQLEGGLVLKGRDGGFFDRFRSRVMFPIADASGKIVAFGGRVLDDSQPKYMNSPETPIYSKGQMLFGLNLAKASKERFFLLVEGYMDLITLHASGIDNAIAPLGTALTPAQGNLIKRFRDEAVIAFDSDAAGRKAALRGLDILDSLGIGVKVLSLPSGKDPDEFVKKNGAAAFLGLIASAAPLVEYKLGLLEAENPEGDAESKVRLLSGAVGVLAAIKSSIKRDVYVKRLASRHGVSEQAICEEIAAAQAAAQASVREPGGRAAGRRGRETGQERQAGQERQEREGGRQGREPGDHAGAVRWEQSRAAGWRQRGAGAAGTAEAGVAGVAGAAARQAGAEPAGGGRAEGAGGPDSASRAAEQAVPAVPVAPAVPAGSADELFVIALLSIDNALWEIAAKNMPPGGFGNKNIARAAEYMGKNIESGMPVFAGDVARFLSPPESDLFAGILANDCHCENIRNAMEQKIRDISVARGRARMAEIISQIESGGVHASEKERLKAQLAEIVAGIGRTKAFGRAKPPGAARAPGGP